MDLLKNSIRSTFAWTLFAFIVLLAVNGTWVARNEWFGLPPKPNSDGPDYEAIGWGVSQGHGFSSHLSSADWKRPYLAAQSSTHFDYRTIVEARGPIVPRTDRPPFLPAVIGLCYLALGNTPIAFATVRIFLACCLSISGALAVGITHYLSRRMLHSAPHTTFFGNVAATGCLVLAALENNIKRYMEDFLTELPAMMFTEIFLISLWWLLHTRKSYLALLAASISFALMVYARSIFILWLPFLLLGLPILLRYSAEQGDLRDEEKANSWSKAVWQASLLCGITFLLLCPWLVRNCIVLDEFRPLGTKGSITLLGGYNDAAYQAGGEWQSEPEKVLRATLAAKYGERLETSVDANLEFERELAVISQRKTREWFTSNWAKIPAMAIGRLITHFNPYTGKSGLVKLLACIGALWLLVRDRPTAALMLGMITINAIIVMSLYSVGGRFLVPLYGIVYTLAALGATFCVYGGWKLLLKLRPVSSLAG